MIVSGVLPVFSQRRFSGSVLSGQKCSSLGRAKQGEGIALSEGQSQGLQVVMNRGVHFGCLFFSETLT